MKQTASKNRKTSNTGASSDRAPAKDESSERMGTSRVSPIDFASRRKAIFEKLGKACMVLHAPSSKVRNSDVHYSFRQDSNFVYVTGLDEMDSLCILSKTTETPFQLFVHPKDPLRELWEGKVLGPTEAKKRYGADAAFASMPNAAFDEAFIAAMLEADALYYRFGLDEAMDRRILGLLKQALRKLGRTGRPLWPLHDPDEILGALRVIKSKPEIDRLQRACDISSLAHANSMRAVKPGMNEYEVEALLYHTFRAEGAGRVGYDSIVASGPNACVLHYRDNNRVMQAGDLLLIDAGAEFDFYTSDITRTFPVSERFTKEQQEVYLAVLRTQKSCIEMARPGQTLRAIHEAAIEFLTEELKRLKVLQGQTKQLIAKKAFFAFYPHGTGHYLGMDVHDVGTYFTDIYSNPRKLEPGMVFTVEPGLYFGTDESKSLKYHGIGVRIEDDVLVTKDGHRVLTDAAPKEIEIIEEIRQS